MRAEVVFGKVTNEELDALVDDPGARLYTYEVREGTEVGDFVMCSNGAPGTVVRLNSDYNDEVAYAEALYGEEEEEEDEGEAEEDR